MSCPKVIIIQKNGVVSAILADAQVDAVIIDITDGDSAVNADTLGMANENCYNHVYDN